MTNVDWARERNNKALSASGRGALSEVWGGGVGITGFLPPQSV